MSYTQPSDFAAWIGYGSEAQYMLSTSPMVYDIAAIQHLYGAAEYNHGDTIYKYDPAKPVSEAIWDSGGTDTLDFSDFTLSCSVNLAPGGYSTIAFTGWTMTDNLGIAYGATIENAIGGGGADTIVGNSAANTLYGGSGVGIKDTLTGNGGADIFVCSLSDATTNLALADIVSDFTNGTDFIGLEDRAFSDLSISNSSGDTKIVDTSSNKVLFVLSSVDHTLIESSDFVVTDFV
jgi:Ca2+-binding RTX toxin-like protein